MNLTMSFRDRTDLHVHKYKCLASFSTSYRTQLEGMLQATPAVWQHAVWQHLLQSCMLHGSNLDSTDTEPSQVHRGSSRPYRGGGGGSSVVTMKGGHDQIKMGVASIVK